MPEIRRGDKGLLEIGSFTYRRVTEDDFSCFVEFSFSLKIGEEDVDLRLPRDGDEPLIGFIDPNGDRSHIIAKLPLDSIESGSEISVYLRRERFWRALDKASTQGPPSIWAHHKVKVAFHLDYSVDFHRSHGSRPVQKTDVRYQDFDLEPQPFPEQLRPGYAGRYELKLIPLQDIRREDGKVRAGTFAVVGDNDRPKVPDPIKVVLKQDAPVRFCREALFAFEIAPQPAPAGTLTPNIVNAIINFKFPGDPPKAPLFEICKISEERSTDGEFWDLTVCAAPPLPFEIVSNAWVKMDYLLAATNRYALCTRLDEIGFLIERWLPARDSKIIIEITLDSYPVAQADPEVHRVEIAFERSGKDLLLVANGDGHKSDGYKAVVFDAHASFSNREDRISFALHSDTKAEQPPFIEVAVINLSHKAVERTIFPSPSSAPVTLQPLVANTSMVRTDYETLTQISIRDKKLEAVVAFSPLVQHPTRVTALDIGTMGIAVAYGGQQDGSIKTAELGEILNRALPPGAARREANYGRMLPSACGITILGGSQIDFPAQCLEKMRLDYRLNTWSRSDNGRADIESRLRLTRARVDLHLPLYDRAQERRDLQAIQSRGLFPIFSVKPQICAHETLSLGDLTSVFRFLRPRDGGADFDEPWLNELSSVDLLAAVLDALLVVYLPHVVQSHIGTGSDHDFVLTYPASIGEDARQRYLSAFKEVIGNLRRDVGSRVPTVENLRGRFHYHLIPEALAACFALAECPGLWTNKATRERIRRLVLFDIGAGTVDVSAIEFQRQPRVEAICQNVSFSQPLGGDVLDAALAQDFLGILAEAKTSKQLDSYLLNRIEGELSAERKTPQKDNLDLLSRIEAGKRLMSTDIFQNRYLPVVLSPRQAHLAPAHGDILLTWDGARFRNWTPPVKLAARGGSDEHHWIVMDLEDRSLHRNLDVYLKAITHLIVVPTLRASGESKENYAEVQVIMSGRASLFRPLQHAIAAGLDIIPEWKTRKLKARLASDILEDEPSAAGNIALGDRSLISGAEAMKSLVARGAGLWSRSAVDRGTAELIPLASHIFNHFALVIGEWYKDETQFATIANIVDIKPGRQACEVPEQYSLFVAVRPSLLERHDISALPVDSDFADELIARCLRPVMLKSLDENPDPEEPPLTSGVSRESPPPFGVSKESPLPFGVPCGNSFIELAPPNSVVQLTAASIDRRLLLQAEVTDSSGVRTTRSWSFSSTFTIQGEF
jgi:hypothetical protein